MIHVHVNQKWNADYGFSNNNISLGYKIMPCFPKSFVGMKCDHSGCIMSRRAREMKPFSGIKILVVDLGPLLQEK